MIWCELAINLLWPEISLSFSLSVYVTYNIADPIIKTTQILHAGSKF